MNCFRDTDGFMWVCGYGSSNGPLGDGYGAQSTTWKEFASERKIIEVGSVKSASDGAYIALTEDGYLLFWGNGWFHHYPYGLANDAYDYRHPTEILIP